MNIAIVTGGSNGIGRATALALGRRGVGVILTYHSHPERAEEVVRAVEANGGARAVALPLDLANRATFEAFGDSVKHELARVWSRETFDYLINNGGVGGPMMLDEMTEEYFDRILETTKLTDHRARMAADLSHGQKQWLEIGMLLAQDPKLLLVDEPVAGMTDAETMQTAELLREIAKDHSVVVVEHDMDFVRELGVKVTVLHEGAVLAEGPLDQVSSDPQVIEVYLGR